MAVEIPEDFLAIDSSNNVHKKITLPGDGGMPTRPGTKVKVHYEGSLWSDGSVFDSSYDRGDPLEFSIGKGQVIKGWDIGIASMKVGEKAELLIQSEFAYGANGSPPKIPANAVLLFKVELVSMDESAADMSIAEKIENAQKAKDAGNLLFKSGEFANAIVEYERGVALLKETFGAEEDQGAIISDLKVSLNSNLAACLLKTKDASKALKACEAVLAIDANHAKATFRFFQSLILEAKFAEAISFIDGKKDILKDVNVDQEILRVKKLQAAEVAKEKAIYSKMFA